MVLYFYARTPKLFPQVEVLWPTFSEIWQNLKLLFEGYPLGYARSILGYLIFGMMAMGFIGVGKRVFELILRTDQSQSDSLSQVSVLESFSLYYIFGSLVFSLLWYGLGSVGLLSYKIALLVGLLGCLVFLMVFFPRFDGAQVSLLKSKVLSWWAQSTTAEKAVVLILIVFLLLLSTTAVYPPLQGDTLATHVTLPSFYIQNGVVSTTPYHFHSYFPQNTEMLVMWALLLNSEFAATLLMWGFHVSFAFLLWGFLKRYTSDIAALLATFIFLSAPVVANSMYIKNDIPASLFVFAHYGLLALALDAQFYSKAKSSSIRRLVLLAGIACGGAIGHKLTSLAIALVSSLLVFGNDLFQRIRRRSTYMLLPAWLLGMALVIAPWMLRTYVVTGNPVYPFFSSQSTTQVDTSFKDDIEKKFGRNVGGFSGFKDFLLVLSAGDKLYFTSWGPTILFVLLVPLLFIKPNLIGIKVCTVGALISMVLLLSYSLSVRYCMSLIVFIVCVGFALSLDIVLREQVKQVLKY